MLKREIFKNKLGNFSVCALVFLIMISWVFSGWPRILDSPSVPPEIQQARAATQEYTSTDTWTADTGVTSVDVECWGAGGAGGGADSAPSSNGGAGGGGGEYAKTTGISVTPDSTYNVIIGAGGTGVSGGNGNPGGDSYFDDGSEIRAKGGSGGEEDDGTAGAGGTGGTGDTKYNGGAGYAPGSDNYGGGGGESAGAASVGTTATGQTGASGVADGGDGGNGGNDGSDGSAGSAPGGAGGGSGGRSGSQNRTGAAGAAGKCVLTWNVPPSITVSQPDGADDTVTVGDSYNITYTLTDAEDDAVVDFYYDSTDSGLDGDAIADCQDQAEGTGATCSWDTTGMTPGDYYVYGIATDSVNSDVSDYSPGQITIEAAGGNATPTVSSVSLNGGNDINLNEGTFKWASSTMTIADDDGCHTISSVVAKLYRTSTSTDGTTCSQDDLNCYIGIGSTTAQNNCIATTTGNECDGGADTSAEYDCGFKIWYIADPTDLGTYAGHVWAVAATTTDSEAATGTATNTAETIEIISLNALGVTALIDHSSVSADSDTDTTNQPTTITTTGNTAIDVELSGTDMIDNGNTIAVGNQKYDTTDQTYDSLASALTGSAVTQELSNTKPTATSTPVTDIVYWGLNVPGGTPQGSYSGTNTFGAVSD